MISLTTLKQEKLKEQQYHMMNQQYQARNMIYQIPYQQPMTQSMSQPPQNQFAFQDQNQLRQSQVQNHSINQQSHIDPSQFPPELQQIMHYMRQQQIKEQLDQQQRQNQQNLQQNHQMRIFHQMQPNQQTYQEQFQPKQTNSGESQIKFPDFSKYNMSQIPPQIISTQQTSQSSLNQVPFPQIQQNQQQLQPQQYQILQSPPQQIPREIFQQQLQQHVQYLPEQRPFNVPLENQPMQSQISPLLAAPQLQQQHTQVTHQQSLSIQTQQEFSIIPQKSNDQSYSVQQSFQYDQSIKEEQPPEPPEPKQQDPELLPPMNLKDLDSSSSESIPEEKEETPVSKPLTKAQLRKAKSQKQIAQKQQDQLKQSDSFQQIILKTYDETQLIFKTEYVDRKLLALLEEEQKNKQQDKNLNNSQDSVNQREIEQELKVLHELEEIKEQMKMAKNNSKQGQQRGTKRKQASQIIEEEIVQIPLEYNKYKKVNVEKGTYTNKFVSKEINTIQVQDGQYKNKESEENMISQPGKLKQRRYQKFEGIKKQMKNFIDKKQQVFRELNDEEKVEYFNFTTERNQKGAQLNKERIETIIETSCEKNELNCENLEDLQDYMKQNLNLFMDGFFNNLYHYVDNEVQFDISQYCEDKQDEDEKKLTYEMSLHKQLLRQFTFDQYKALGLPQILKGFFEELN